jgi:hypothetical protein
LPDAAGAHPSREDCVAVLTAVTAARSPCTPQAWRSGQKASVHAVLAKQGVQLRVSDVFGVGSRQLVAKAPLDAAYRLRVNALVRLIDARLALVVSSDRMWARSIQLRH